MRNENLLASLLARAWVGQDLAAMRCYARTFPPWEKLGWPRMGTVPRS